MKKTEKQLTAAALACASVFSIAACKNEKETVSGDIPTLVWYVPGNKQNDMASVMEEANKIVEPAIGARIDLQMIDAGAFQEKVNMMMAASEQFDLVFTGAGNSYRDCVQKGGLLDITDMIDEYAPKLKDIVIDYAMEEVTIDGRLYGVPNMQIMAGARAFNIQKKYAEEFGLDYDSITCPEDLEPFLEWVHNRYPDLYPYHTGQGVGVWDCVFYSEEECTLGYSIEDLVDGDNHVDIVWLRETDIDRQAVDTLRRWYLKGYIRPDVLSVMDDSLDQKAGKYVVTTGMWKPGCEAEMLNNTGREYVTVIYGDNYKKANNIPIYRFGSGAANTMISVSRTCKEPEKAVKFIELINTNSELYNLIAFGIEGKHYTTNEDNKIVLNADSGYYQNASWKFGCTYNAKVMNGQDANVWEETRRVNEEAIASPATGFTFDTKPVINEISAVTTINSQYKVLATGAEDKSVYWDEYLEKMQTAGIEKLRQEYERQINEFLASKAK